MLSGTEYKTAKLSDKCKMINAKWGMKLKFINSWNSMRMDGTLHNSNDPYKEFEN